VNGVYQYQPLEANDLEEHDGKPGVGCMCFEGLTSFSSSLFISLTRRKDIHIPETPKDCFVTEEDEYYGFSGRAHYGFVQNRIQEAVNFSNSLPFEKMIWTALEADGKDNETGETCYGPAISGNALTSKAPAWFGNCVHLQPIESDEVIDDGRKDLHKMVKQGVPVKKIRAYLANHPHKITGKMYLAKGRISAWVNKEMPPFFDVVIDGDVVKGLNWVYEMEDMMVENASRKISERLTRKPPVEEYKVFGKERVVVGEIVGEIEGKEVVGDDEEKENEIKQRESN
jgi:hypothetical protein